VSAESGLLDNDTDRLRRGFLHDDSHAAAQVGTAVLGVTPLRRAKAAG
jgi:hypothetical protein